MLKRIIGEDIELKSFLAHELPNIYADPSQIEQVIMNLAVNARDAMPHGGVLTISTSMIELDETFVKEYSFFTTGRYVLLAVSDTGSGIKKEDLEHIFEPFFTTKEIGTGLGLATVYGIVKQSGGNILVESNEGKGTTFKIFFPVTDMVHEGETLEEKKEIKEGEGQHILVVEDEESVRDMIYTVLKDRGFSVTLAKNGIEAMELLQKNNIKPNLLITDVVMPGMSGSELVEYVKKIMPELKILFISGYTEETMIKHGLTDKEIFFLQKPFLIEDFLLQIQKLISDVKTH